MTKIIEIRNFARTTPMGARFISILREHGESLSVDYYSDPDGRKPIRVNVSPNAQVITKDVFQAMTEAHVDKMVKAPVQVKQKARATRKGDNDENTDERGAMKFPHSEKEKEWAGSIEYDAKRDAQRWDYPDYRQTGIDDSMFIYGREVEKQMRRESIELDSDGLTEGKKKHKFNVGQDLYHKFTGAPAGRVTKIKYRNTLDTYEYTLTSLKTFGFGTEEKTQLEKDLKASPYD